jgi:hypothetical protein
VCPNRRSSKAGGGAEAVFLQFFFHVLMALAEETGLLRLLENIEEITLEKQRNCPSCQMF